MNHFPVLRRLVRGFACFGFVAAALVTATTQASAAEKVRVSLFSWPGYAW